jgi:hypothetical protein
MLLPVAHEPLHLCPMCQETYLALVQRCCFDHIFHNKKITLPHCYSWVPTVCKWSFLLDAQCFHWRMLWYKHNLFNTLCNSCSKLSSISDYLSSWHVNSSICKQSCIMDKVFHKLPGGTFMRTTFCSGFSIF